MRTLTVVALCVLLAVSPATAATSTPQTEPPLADAGLDQTVQQGATVHLDATGSRDPDGDIASYEWSIETPSGATTAPECAACARTSFVAEQTGTYAVTVEATDDEGATKNDTLYVTVEPPPDGPTVSLSGPTQPTVGSDGRYTASLTAGDAPVERLVWHVDGERVAKHDVGSGTAIEHTFESTRRRTITVTAYDENGREATDELTVRPREPSATPQSEQSTGPGTTEFSGGTRSTGATGASETAGPASDSSRPTPSLTVDGPTTVFAGESNAYVASADNVPTGAVINWAAGDEGSRVTRNWDTTGTYTVAASTIAHGTEVRDSLTVDVIDPSIEIIGPTEVKTGIFASFTARTSGVPDDATLRWDNGETGDTTGRKWSEPGTYTIEVTTTVAGRVISDTHTVNVTELVVEDPNKPPKVDIDDPGSLTAGEDVTLTATYSDPDGRVVDVEWDPGQTVTVPGPNNNLVVSVTVTDNDGAKATDEITIQTHESGVKENSQSVKCYYEDPYEKVRNAPSGGCEASWGESWTQKDVSTNWGGTVGQYDVTWMKVENRDTSETTTTATDDPVKHCMGCNNLRDNSSGSNPTQQQSGSTSSTTADTGSYTKNGQTVHNDLTGDGVVNVIDWNRRFDNGYVDGPGGGNSNFDGAGPSLALRGANGQQVGAGAGSGGGSWTDTIAAPTSNGGDGPGEVDDSNDGSSGGNGVPSQENADPGGTNGQVDADADGTRSEGQSMQDYKEEFTATLDLDI